MICTWKIWTSSDTLSQGVWEERNYFLNETISVSFQDRNASKMPKVLKKKKKACSSHKDSTYNIRETTKSKNGQTWTDISPKRTPRWPRNTWKDAQPCSLLEKHQSKLQWDVTSHGSECPSSKKSTNNKCLRGREEKETLLNSWWECKRIQPLWTTVWRFLKIRGVNLPCGPAIPLLGIYPEKTTRL